MWWSWPCASRPGWRSRGTQWRCVGRLGRTIRTVAVPLCTGVPVFLNVHPVELSERWLVRPDDPMYAHDEPVFLETDQGFMHGRTAHREFERDVLLGIRLAGAENAVAYRLP